MNGLSGTFFVPQGCVCVYWSTKLKLISTIKATDWLKKFYRVITLIKTPILPITKFVTVRCLTDSASFFAARLASCNVFAFRRISLIFQHYVMLTEAKHRTDAGLLKFMSEPMVLLSYCSIRSARGPLCSALQAAKAAPFSTTEKVGYSDTLRQREKCHCKRLSL